MRFKAGDKVRVRTWADLRKEYGHPFDSNRLSIRLGFNSEMRKLCGKVVTIQRVNTSNESYNIFGSCWNWGDEMFENTIEEKRPIKMRTGRLSEVEDDHTFTIAGIEMYKIHKEGDGWLCLFAEPVFQCAYGSSPNYAKSDIHRRLTEETLPQLEAKIGTDNLLEFVVDLKHFDHKNKYVDLKTKIGILSYKQINALEYSNVSNIAGRHESMLSTSYGTNSVLHRSWSGTSSCALCDERAILPVICLADNVEVSYGG